VNWPLIIVAALAIAFVMLYWVLPAIVQYDEDKGK
jgi:hypothetical protein